VQHKGRYVTPMGVGPWWPEHGSNASCANVAKGEGFRTPALGDGRARGGAGVRKPPKEETAGRKGRCLGRARSMAI
jgi:hypothetical protein